MHAVPVFPRRTLVKAPELLGKIARIACGIVFLFLPLGAAVSLAGFVMIGLGCAPIYPCIIHATPEHFGADKSQAVIGIQMAYAYVGTSLMPPQIEFLHAAKAQRAGGKRPRPFENAI